MDTKEDSVSKVGVSGALEAELLRYNTLNGNQGSLNLYLANFFIPVVLIIFTYYIYTYFINIAH